MPDPRNANGHRRRQRRRELLAQASRLTCPWPGCPWPGQVFDTSVHYLEPRAPEVDEIVPISKGGSPIANDNTRLMHRWCNQQRGDGKNDARPAPPQTYSSAGW